MRFWWYKDTAPGTRRRSVLIPTLVLSPHRGTRTRVVFFPHSASGPAFSALDHRADDGSKLLIYCYLAIILSYTVPSTKNKRFLKNKYIRLLL